MIFNFVKWFKKFKRFFFIAGEWKLFGLEQMRSTNPAQGTPNAEPRSSALAKYAPPELKSSPYAETTAEQDMWGLGCIVWEVFNGPLQSANDLGRIGNIPKKLSSTYKELVAANPNHRPNTR